MLKKENRLTAEKDFGRVFKGSRPVHTQNLVFRFINRKTPTKLRIERNYEITNKELKANKLIPNSYNLNSRFGFVISNKISKLATRRNALKRQLRAIIEKELTNIKSGYDVVIMVKLDFSYPYEQEAIKEQVREGLQKTGLKISN